MLPTSSVLGRAVKRSRKAGVCFLLPFPASQETRAQAVPPLFTPTGSNGSPRRGVASEAIPPLGSLRPTFPARREAVAVAVGAVVAVGTVIVAMAVVAVGSVQRLCSQHSTRIL